MRKLLKRCIALIFIPATRWYLRKERTFKYRDITVKVFPGVFHPGLFYSTKFICDFLVTQPIRNQSLLELGCGTGLISIICAKAGALVTASDISKTALKNIATNVSVNQVSVDIIYSDIFDNLAQKTFDWIIINPPYYAKAAESEHELAWHCGKDFEYFQKLFETLGDHIHTTTKVVMVLTLSCELEKILEIARKNGFQFELIKERKAFFDGKDFLYSIRRIKPVA